MAAKNGNKGDNGTTGTANSVPSPRPVRVVWGNDEGVVNTHRFGSADEATEDLRDWYRQFYDISELDAEELLDMPDPDSASFEEIADYYKAQQAADSGGGDYVLLVLD